MQPILALQVIAPSERYSRLQSHRPRLVHKEPWTPRNLRRNRAIVTEVRELIGQILTNQGDFVPVVAECDTGIEQAIGRPLARVARTVVAAETTADVRVVYPAHQPPAI